MSSTRIDMIRAREVLDSRGNPTVQADVLLECGALARIRTIGCFDRCAMPLPCDSGDPMIRQVRAVCDSSLTARVIRRRPLYYSAGADPAQDRPAHVRAGSGLARLGDRLAVIQDDANFLALVDPHGHTVDAIALPRGPGGERQFDERRGNKQRKLDLEACVSIVDAEGELFVAFGSGSTFKREHVLALAWTAAGPGDLRLHHAPAFYAWLRSHRDFAGSELNIEGAVHLERDCLRLFQRGNGAPRQGRLPLDASCDLSWSMLREHLTCPASPAPPLENITQYDLGHIDKIRLSFTDAAAGARAVFFTAAAEESPDAVEDGPVRGSVLGQIDSLGTARWTVLLGEDGKPLGGKVEGLSLQQRDGGRAWILIDGDDSAAVSELCEVELLGDWAE